MGISDGRIVALGDVADAARETLDASGLIVAPGFVDLHTHYDAQVFWDGALSPSSYHGVTSIIGGNCGFSVAPLEPDQAEYLMRMLARVEGMPLESLEAGVPWDWRGFGEYLDRIEGRVAVNAGFLVGHSALRRVVMGKDAVGKQASPAQLESMARLLRESIEAGGLGFSSSRAATHNDGDGNPVPSRHASRDEIVALCRVLRDLPGTSLEFLPGIGIFDDETKQLMTDMSLAARRPLNWNVLGVASYAPQMTAAQLSASDHAAARGGKVVALTPSQVMVLRINLVSGFIFDAFPEWAPVIALPLEARKRALRDPAVRERLEKGASSEAAGPIVDEALKLDPLPKVIWMQLTVRNDEAAARAEARGVKVVMNRCPKMEYGKLSGEWGWVGGNSGIVSSRRQTLHASGKLQSLGLNPSRR